MAGVRLLDELGQEAVVGKSHGYWLGEDDFVSSEGSCASKLGTLGFPREWPAVYSQSKALKSLIGKRGKCASKHVSVIGRPTSQQLSSVDGLDMRPLQSFANARLVERVSGLCVVQGWAIFEHLDLSPSSGFVAERFWWNVLPDGQWLDFTPRPAAWPQLVLAESVEFLSKERAVLSDHGKALMHHLLQQRFPEIYVRWQQAPCDVNAGDAEESELVKLRAELAAAVKDADEACAKYRALETEAALLRQHLIGENVFSGCFNPPSDTGVLSLGGLARIHGLKDSSELNGQNVEVTQWDEKRGRWKVRLSTGELRALLPANLAMLDKPHDKPELSAFGLEVVGDLTDGSKYNLWPLVYSGFLRTRVPDRLLHRLNVQFDALYEDALSPSHSVFLQAEVKNGKQITVVEPDGEYRQLLLDCCQRLVDAILQDDAAGMTCELDTVWTVHQLAGDYNPIHFHTNPNSHFGFSSFLHLVLPPQLNPAQQRLPRTGGRGHHDGVTSFVWKPDGPLDKENLELPGTVECDLVEGYLHVFPQWLQHQVMPFYGKGERRTVAANVALSTRADMEKRSRRLNVEDPGDPRKGVKVWQYR